MMCAPRELALPNAPQKRGIIELDDSAVVGEAFDQPNTGKVNKTRSGKKAAFLFVIRKVYS